MFQKPKDHVIFQFFTDLSMIAPTVATASYMHRHHIPVHMYTFNHHSLEADEHWWGSYHSLGKRNREFISFPSSQSAKR